MLIDLISIDQQLDSAEEMQKVVAFSHLYRTTQVLCVYNDHETTLHVMQRPWIWLEICQIRSNKTSITVLVSTNSKSYGTWVERRVDLYYVDPDGRDERRVKPGVAVDINPYYLGPDYDYGKKTAHEFASRLLWLTPNGFLPAIFALMLGNVQTRYSSDLRYSLPPLAPALSAAYKLTSKEIEDTKPGTSMAGAPQLLWLNE